MRICGVTFDHTTNYGSCLQAVALKKAIERLEIDGTRCSYDLLPICNLPDYPGQPQNTLQKLRRLMYLWHRLQFDPFENEYLSFAECKDLSSLVSLNDRYDAFVCGSDVIWRQDLNFGLGAFYLSFAEKYAFSYAASFGVASPDEEWMKQIVPWISRLRSIGVRETSGQQLIADAVGKEVTHVTDPVLLLNADEWSALAEPEKKDRHGSIFVYTTHPVPAVDQTVAALKRKTCARVVQTVWRRGMREYPLHMLLLQLFTHVLKPTPARWLRELRDADFVVTNSFHATVFSVLFHKRFFTVVNGNISEQANIRMYDLLTEMGLADRMFSEMPPELSMKTPDFSKADEVIASLRKSSLAYLQRNLEAAFAEAKKTKGESAHVEGVRGNL